jgi:hypothetical protein
MEQYSEGLERVAKDGPEVNPKVNPEDKRDLKVVFEGGSFRTVCDGALHFGQLLIEQGKWGEDHDIRECTCTKAHPGNEGAD